MYEQKGESDLSYGPMSELAILVGAPGVEAGVAESAAAAIQARRHLYSLNHAQDAYLYKRYRGSKTTHTPPCHTSVLASFSVSGLTLLILYIP